MKLKNYYLAICSVALLFLSTSCGQFVKLMAVSAIKIEKGAIPPNFGKDESTLICVITGKKSYDKHVKKQVSNEYHGKYEFVLRDQVNSDKYKDKSKYRYVFDLNTIHKSRATYNTTTTYYSDITTTASYYILDRRTNIVYRSPVTSSFYSKLIQAYMINLEAVRLKNQ
ncbi:hypothetical protein [Hugenholtzia roseola]|uniref:hypothetical protein n=1 Tax=Hugenholtzia roseola TaxID=1002 RepID=UPI00047E0278|nr:hypothetical protein [Hugenholtzia roseola]